MHEILKLRLQGFSPYKIARKLELEPPTVYAGLKAAKQNFPEADKMLMELKALGWPQKLAEIEKSTRPRQKRTAEHAETSETPSRSEEVAMKFG